MKRLVASLALALALGATIFVMREATQNRADAVVAGSVTTVEFDVETHRYERGEEAAAVALWSVCAASVGGTTSPVPTAVGDHWRVEISPAIGEHGENRLVGCLEDVTIDRVVGDVLAISTER